MAGNHNSRIARLERIRAFHKAGVENLQAVLVSSLETHESQQKARRELLRVLETLNAAERELTKLKAKRLKWYIRHDRHTAFPNMEPASASSICWHARPSAAPKRPNRRR